MTTTVRSTLSAAAFFAASGLLMFGALPAAAQAPGSAERAQQERATCDGVQQDRAACLREAGAARQEAGRNGLTSVGPARADGEVMALLRQGLQGAGRTRFIDEIRGEFVAIDSALARLAPGDLSLILVDQVEEALAHLAKRIAEG